MSWCIGSGDAEHSQSLSRMALILTLVNGGSWSLGTRRRVCQGVWSRAESRSQGIPTPVLGRQRCNSHGTECEHSCLLQSQLWARSAPYRSHLLGRGWQDEPSLAPHVSSGLLQAVQPTVEEFCTQPLPVPQRRATHSSSIQGIQPSPKGHPSPPWLG